MPANPRLYFSVEVSSDDLVRLATLAASGGFPHLAHGEAQSARVTSYLLPRIETLVHQEILLAERTIHAARLAARGDIEIGRGTPA